MDAGLLSGGKKDVRTLMLGLDGSGKTAMLYRYKLGEYVETIPTTGFNVETISHKRMNATVWDVGGQETVKPPAGLGLAQRSVLGRSVHCGATTTKTHKLSSGWWTAPTATASRQQTTSLSMSRADS